MPIDELAFCFEILEVSADGFSSGIEGKEDRLGIRPAGEPGLYCLALSTRLDAFTGVWTPI